MRAALRDASRWGALILLAIGSVNSNASQVQPPAVAPQQSSAPGQVNASPTHSAPSAKSELTTLQDSLSSQQDELNQLQARMSDDRQAIERLELDRNEARMSEARMRQAITQETDSFLSGQANNGSLDSLRSDYVQLSAKRQKLDAEYLTLTQMYELDAQKVMKLKATLSERQVKLDSHLNARDKKAILEVRKHTPTHLEFNQRLTFSCSAAKVLNNCLKQKDITPLIQGKVTRLYTDVLQKMPVKRLSHEPLVINETEFSYTATHSFLNATMSMDGKVDATVSVDVTVRPGSSLACTYLGVAQSLCSQELYALTVRSNKQGDQVMVGGINYGATPVVLALPKGEHEIRVKVAGVQQQRVVKVLGDKAVNFKF